jgi:hypothetical protein
MTTKKPDSDKIVGKVLEKLADVLRNYNEVVDTISQQKVNQTIDYDYLSDKMTHSIKSVHSIEAAIHKMADKKIDVPNLLPFVVALKNAAESYELVLSGLKSKAQNTGKYGFFAYRKDLKNFEEKRRILAIRQREFSKNISSSEQNEEQVETETNPKTISAQTVASGFAQSFLEDIDKRRDEVIEILTSKESGGKLSVSEDKARAMLFYSFFAFWTLPLFNLFDQEKANDIFSRVCVILAEAYETDAEELAEMTLDIRDYYNSTIVENAQRMKSSAWLVDNLVDDPGMFTYMHIDALLVDSLVFNWKKLSEEYTVK